MKSLVAVFLVIFCLDLQAQPPSGYYDQADGKEANELLDALHTIIKNPNTVSYGSVDEKFVQLGTDEDPNNASNIILFYTRDSRPSSSFTGNGDGNENTGGWNKEHVWPRSRGVGDSGDDQQDMHMLRPTDVDVNSRRGNKDFGEVSGNNTSNSSYFEPHDDVKGDVARILFYMVTCYQGSLELVESVTNSSSQLANLSLMLQWHEDDPVDSYEKNRNDLVYSQQGNRNPFIDHPEWVDCIWGSGNCSDDSGGGGSGSALMTVDKGEFDGDFGNVPIGAHSEETKYTISGSDLPENVLVTAPTDFEISLISGTDFTGSLSLTVNEGELPSTDIFVRFTPSQEGAVSRFISHTSGPESAEVILTGTGVTGDQVITQSPKTNLQSIYPNPASGIVKLEHLNFPRQELKIFDSNGRRMPLHWKGGDIDVSGYEQGVYYLTLPLHSRSQAFRILVR